MTTCLCEESTAVNAQRPGIKSLQQKKLNDLDSDAATKMEPRLLTMHFFTSLIAEGLLMLLESNVGVPCRKGGGGVVHVQGETQYNRIVNGKTDGLGTTCLCEGSTGVNAQRSNIKSLQFKKLNGLDSEAATKNGAKACNNAFLASLIAEGLLMLLESNVSVPCCKGDGGAVQSMSKARHSTIGLSTAKRMD